MGLLTPTRRVYHRWKSVLPLYDGRQCPDCGAVVCGREARREHRELHMRTEQWQEWVADTFMRIAKHVGIPTIEPAVKDQAAGVTHVDLRAPDYGDDEEDDDG